MMKTTIMEDIMKTSIMEDIMKTTITGYFCHLMEASDLTFQPDCLNFLDMDMTLL